MHPEKLAARNVRLLYAFWFLRDFHLWIPVWIVFLIVERGFSLTDVTVAEGLFLLGVLVLEVPTGAIADKWGRSRSLALGAFFLGISVFIFAFTTSFAILLTSFLLWSVASTLMSGADSALLFDTLKAARRDSEYERIAGRGHAFSWAAAGLGTFLGGPVAYVLDIRATILMGAGTCVATAIVALAMWEPEHQQEREGASERYVASIRRAFGVAWRAREVRAVILVSGTAMASMEAVHYLVQPYLLDRGIEVGVMFSMLQVPTIAAGILGALLAATLQSRGWGRLLLVVIPGLGAVAYVGLAVAPGLAAYPVLPVMFLIGSCLMPLATGQINRAIDSEQRATILSIHGMVVSLLLAALAPGLGYTTDRWGMSAAFSLGAAITVLSLALFGSMLLASPAGKPQPAAPLAAEG